MAGDSEDSDFEDTFSQPLPSNNNVNVNEDTTAARGNINKDGKTVRGKDINWLDFENFETVEDYFASDLFKKISDEFTLRRKHEWDYADIEIHTCKFARRIGFLPCPWQLKVSFLSTSDAVVVETTDEASDHRHEEDHDYVQEGSSMFRWSSAATAIVTTGVKNEARPKIILRNLRDANVFDGMVEPTMIQLYNKITNIKNILNNTKDILTTHDLRQMVMKNLDIPESDIEAYIPFSEIIDDDEKEDPKFTIIITTKKLMERVSSDKLFQVDATYRLVWQGYPVFITGTSTPTGKFFGSMIILSSHEDTFAWANIYRYIRDIQKYPKFHMGDGAKEITKALHQVFNEEPSECSGMSVTRLMCYPHVYRNIVPQLKPIKSVSKELADEILADLEFIQWSSLNKDTFLYLCELVTKKYVDMDVEDPLKSLIGNFFAYFNKVWVRSKESNWFKGSNPWGAVNNQGLEGKNKEIKASHTFRKRMPLGKFFAAMFRMAKEWSKEDDSLLYSNRLALMDTAPGGLKIRTEGYKWYKDNNNKPDRIMKVVPNGRYTVSEDPQFLLGKVENIWLVASCSASPDTGLKTVGKQRIAERKIPTAASFEEYKKMRSSCWIVEERKSDGKSDMFCDCPVGQKGKLCKHCIGLLYKIGQIEVTSEVRSQKLGQKRKRGRPKKLPMCLVRSPVQSVPAPSSSIGSPMDISMEATSEVQGNEDQLDDFEEEITVSKLPTPQITLSPPSPPPATRKSRGTGACRVARRLVPTASSSVSPNPSITVSPPSPPPATRKSRGRLARRLIPPASSSVPPTPVTRTSRGREGRGGSRGKVNKSSRPQPSTSPMETSPTQTPNRKSRRTKNKL